MRGHHGDDDNDNDADKIVLFVEKMLGGLQTETGPWEVRELYQREP